MTVGALDKRLVTMLLAGVAVILGLRFWLSREPAAPTAAVADSVPAAEARLQRLRETVASLPGKEAVLKQASAELALREKSVIQADTTPQAQAQMLDIVRRVAMANGIDARGAEQLGEARPLGSDYGEVTVTVPFTCGIDQLINFLAALPNEPVLLATSEIHISGGTDKKKNLQVRVSLSGVVPKKLVPVRRGLGRS